MFFLQIFSKKKSLTVKSRNGDREVKDQIKTRRRFFCNSFVAQTKYFLVGCFRWGVATFGNLSSPVGEQISPPRGGNFPPPLLNFLCVAIFL